MEKTVARKWKYWPVACWVLWLVFSFFAASFVVAAALLSLQYAGVVEDAQRLGTTAKFIVDASIYVAMFLIAVGLPFCRWRKNQKAKKASHQQRPAVKFVLKLVGLSRWPKWGDVKDFLIHVPVYYLMLVAVSMVATVIFAVLLGEDITREMMGQAQNVGFATGVIYPWWQLGLIFVALVVIAPLFEEMMMRGLLFGKLRRILPFWPTAVIVSLLFALAHGQINAGIMTFILAMFTCHLRERTGAIWGGAWLHMLQNLVAFGALFLGWFGGISG